MISDQVAITPDVAACYPAPLYDPVMMFGSPGGTRRVEQGSTVIIAR